MAVDPERWYFTKEQLFNSPSRKHGIDPEKELSYRQQSANLIQDMGQRMNVTQLCINTAIVYMHRFYMHHSFSKFHRNSISPACLFLAAKVEEQPRKLEHVVRVAHACLHRGEGPPLDPQSEAYLEKAQDIVILETILLQTVGFNVAVEHPHTYVVKCTQLIRASKDLAQTAYFMATNSLHLTTFSLQYKPTCIACVCIHLACKWSSWEQIPLSSDGKHWWEYVDPAVNKSLLNELTSEFVQIMDRCPSRLKRKIHITNIKGGQKKLKGGEPSSAESSPGVPSISVVPKIQPSTSRQNTELTNHDRQGKIEIDFKPKPESQMTYKDYKVMKERKKLAIGKVKSEPNTAHSEHKEHRHKQSEHSHRVHVEKKPSSSEVRPHSKELKHAEQRPVKMPEHHKPGVDQRVHGYHKPPVVEHHTPASGEQHRPQSSEHSHHKPSSAELQHHRPSSSDRKPPSDHHRSSSSERRSHGEHHKQHSSDRKAVPPEATREKHHSHHKQYIAEATPNGTKLKIKVPPPQGKSEKHPPSGLDAQQHAALKERERHKHHHHHHQKHHSSSEKHAAALKHAEKHRPSSSSGKRPHSPDAKLRASHSVPQNRPVDRTASPAKKIAYSAVSHDKVPDNVPTNLSLPSSQSLLSLPMPPGPEADIIQQALMIADTFTGGDATRNEVSDYSSFFSQLQDPSNMYRHTQHSSYYSQLPPPSSLDNRAPQLPFMNMTSQQPLPPGPPPPPPPLPDLAPPPLPPPPPE